MKITLTVQEAENLLHNYFVTECFEVPICSITVEIVNTDPDNGTNDHDVPPAPLDPSFESPEPSSLE